jgi:hypothetical protein
VLRSLNDLRRYGVAGIDGDLGWVHDFLFDERDWVIRYLVIDTGPWLLRQRVLITWGSVIRADPVLHQLRLNLTRRELRYCPAVDAAVPSWYRDMAASDYCTMMPAWLTPGVLAPPAFSLPKATLAAGSEATDAAGVHPGGSTLRSVMNVTGYAVEAPDGLVGYVKDFIGEEDTWTIRHLVIATRSWLPTKKVLVSSRWVQRLCPEEAKVHVDRRREVIKNGPEYDSSTPVNRAYEVRLYDYCGRPCCWQETSNSELRDLCKA